MQGLGGILGLGVSASQNAKSIKKASKAQIAGMDRAIDEEQRQYDTTRADYKPYLDAGTTALPGIMDLLGLNGPDKGLAAIDHLKASPEYQSLYDNGEEAVLQNASATGGLRGGNTQRGLADFGRDTLSQIIGTQLSRLGGLAGLGVGATDSVAGFGAHTADQVGNFDVGIGNAKAGSILGQQGVWNNFGNQVSQLITKIMGQGAGGF